MRLWIAAVLVAAGMTVMSVGAYAHCGACGKGDKKAAHAWCEKCGETDKDKCCKEAESCDKCGLHKGSPGCHHKCSEAAK